MQHPSTAELQAFLTGEVDQQVASRILAHLETCTACEQVTEQLESQQCEIATPFQTDAGEAPFVAEAALAQALANAKQAGDAVTTSNENTLNDQTLEFDPNAASPTRAQGETEAGKLPSTWQDRKPSAAPVKPAGFGDFEIIEEIARGGMGVVFKARQRSLGRLVALKMIKSGALADKQDVQRFYAEAQAAANLDHPHIVPVHEVGQHDGQHYFAMAFVEGPSLADRIADGVLQPKEAAALVKQITEAIAFAHSMGIIHRDLKPANVLLATSGDTPVTRQESSRKNNSWKPDSSPAYTPKVTDFGLAKRMDQDDGMTATGQIMGTPAYMPPEQAQGRVAEIGETADVYSLGAILYCTLIGRPPFQAAAPLDIIRQVIDQEPVPPRRIDRTIPIDLETICLKCLEKDPARRYTSAQELVSDLDCFLNDRPVSARPIGNTGKLIRWSRRNPVVAGLLSLVALTLLVGICVSSLFALQAQHEAGEARKSSEVAVQQKTAAEEAKRNAVAAQGRAENAKRQAVSDREKAEAAQKAAEQAKAAAEAARKRAEAAEQRAKREATGHWRALGQARIALSEAYYQDENTVDMIREMNRVPKLLRNELWRYLERRSDPTIASLDLPESGALRFACAIPESDGRFVVSGTSGAFIMNGWTCKYEGQLVNEDGKKEPRSLYPSTFSPDGKYYLGVNILAFSLEVFDLATRKRVARWALPERPPVMFDPSGKFYAANGSGAEQRDFMTGKVLAKRAGFVLFAIAPKTGLLIGSEKNQLLALKSLNGPVVWKADDVLSSHTVHASCSPDGEFVTVLHEGNRIRTYRAGVNGPEVRLPLYSVAAPAGQFSRVIYSRHGHSFITVGRETVSATIRIWDRDSGLMTHSLLGLPRSAQEPAYEPQSGLLVIPYGRGVKTWRLNIDAEAAIFPAAGKNFAFASDTQIWRAPSVEQGIARYSLQGDQQMLFKPSTRCLDIAVSQDRKTALLDKAGSGLLLLRNIVEKPEEKPIGYHRVTRSVAVSPAGTRAAAMEYKGRISVYDTQRVRGLMERHIGTGGKQNSGNHVAFLSDSRFIGLRPLALLSVHELAVGSTDGKLLQKKRLEFMVHGVAVAADGASFALACGDRSIRIYDSKTLELRRPPFRVHDQQITALCFHPKLPLLATASADYSVRLWDTRSAEQVGEFLGFGSAPRSLDFTPSGKQLGALATRLRVWNIEPVIQEFRKQQPAAKDKPPGGDAQQ